MAKKVHWTQTPEGRERMRQITLGRHTREKGKSKATRTKHRRQNKRVTKHPEKILTHTPDRTLLVQYAELKTQASQRITDIDDQIVLLEKEREELLANFPDARRSNGRGLREVKEA